MFIMKKVLALFRATHIITKQFDTLVFPQQFWKIKPQIWIKYYGLYFEIPFQGLNPELYPHSEDYNITWMRVKNCALFPHFDWGNRI